MIKNVAADMPLERKTPIGYPDGVYEIVPEEERANALLVSNISQHGLSGMGARRRTAFFTFFGEYSKMARSVVKSNHQV